MASTQAEVREFITHVRQAGYKVAKTGNGAHYKVLDLKGAVVSDEKGPLIISGSPSETRWKEMHVHRFMQAGVLKFDPYKPTGQQGHKNGDGGEKPKKRGGGRITDPDVQAAKLRAIKARSDGFRERTAVLRSRVEPVISKLGGWGQGKYGVGVSEFGEVVYHWAKRRGRIELPKTTSHGAKAGTDITPAHVGANVGRLKHPEQTIGGTWLPLFEVFADELERNAGVPVDPVKAAARYRELLLEAKGLAPRHPSPAAGPPQEIVPVPEPKEEKEKHGPLHDKVAAPTLALRALFHMARDPEVESKVAVDIATEIAELELNDQRGKA